MSENQYANIAANIKRLRLLNNFTQEKLSELLHTDTQYYSQLETGKRNFSIPMIIECCKIFHCSIDEIIVVEDLNNDDNSEYITRITEKLQNCGSMKLAIIEKIMDDLLAYL